jgi:DNA-binding CsgD family transcriptional regulator
MTITVPFTPRDVVHPIVLSGPADLDAALATATREVLTVRPYPGGPLRLVDRANLRRGVRYRVLVPPAGLGAVPRDAQLLGADGPVPHGAQLRRPPGPVAEVTVIDRAVALLPSGHAAGLATFRLAAVVEAVVTQFDRWWSAAAPEPAAGVALGDRERHLLALLAAGLTDESAAARLGVSVRTVRRMMSAIMDRLGARSRFEAGLKAARSGLPGPGPDHPGPATVGSCAGTCHRG